ncbi:hypothetical protein HCC70_03430 [Streptococcus suis]|uniref:PepSY domain-containing protein n=1 Tax=Streptococcus suivaginalis TaxID=3028082 RepID=A0AA96VDF0_9STRE|nr:PepSY domain-containing protein [Streptococcus sp. 29896]MCK4027391.1 hypothetical protein [Streptococcus suis]WNY47097.1 PepSY domain-containing protein [Streptococcus sp. 29896]
MKHLKLLTLTALVATSVGLHQTVSAAQIKSVEAAKSIALKDLGLSARQVRFKEVDLEKGVYEVDFVANNVEYDYDIDGITGKVIKKKIESQVAKTTSSPKNLVVTPQPQNASALPTLTVEQVKKLVLKDLDQAANNVQFKEVDLEKGMYEIEVVTNNSEFDYKINGITGQIMKKKVEAKKLEIDKCHKEWETTLLLTQ